MGKNIGLIDYGMGNLHSVRQSFLRLETSVKIIKTPSELQSCEALILPGVGAFDPAMDNLKNSRLIPSIKRWANEGKPLLGICLGLQLLFESSDEGSSKGLGVFKGHIKHLPKDQLQRIPHMGWSQLNQKKKCPLLENKTKPWMYFVHSFAAEPTNPSDLAASTKFGQADLTAIVWQGKIGACQFHPEKSGNAGQKLIARWLNWLNSESLLEL